MKKYFIFAAAIAMAACSNDGSEQINPSVQKDDVIRLSACVGGAVQTRAGAALMHNQFASGKTIKVKPTDKASVKEYDEVVYTADGSGGLNPTVTQYYPAGGGTVDIYAYYPSNASTATDGYVVTLDQSTDAAYEAVDLMYATLTDINKESSEAARTLNFNHKLSKIIVTLAKGTGIQDSELAIATVKLKNVIYKGTFAPGTGTFTAASATTDNLGDVIIANNAGQTHHSAIVIPQSVSGKIIEVTIGSTAKEYTIPSTTEFETGKVYYYTITLNATGISVQSSIANWNNGGTVDDANITF